MRLITDEEVKALPKLYETESVKTDDKVLQVKFVEVNIGWEWYLVEFDAKGKIAFGFIKGFEEKWGYFSLAEIEDRHTILRDHNFQPMMFKDLKDS